MGSGLAPEYRALLAAGTVIPAHPLALTGERRLDERRQRGLTRYYAAAGAGGIAVGVHTTQFAIRDPGVGLLSPVLRIAAEEAAPVRRQRPFLLVAGVCGPSRQAVAEAELAAALGYDLALLSPGGLAGWSDDALIERAAAVAAVLPVFGFYLQPAVGGRALSGSFWRRLCDLEGVAAVKIAPFNRYQTLDVVRAVCASERRDAIALYTGNDDHIVLDLLTPFAVRVGRSEVVTRRIVGGLLGQWAVWTERAVAMLEGLRREREAGGGAPAAGGEAGGSRDDWLTLAGELTDANAAVFDAAGGFAGCIPGIHEVLRRQGLLAGRWCLDPHEDLSPGQADEITRVCRDYPHLRDDAFVAAHLAEWLA